MGEHRVKRWADEHAVGRVFEIRSAAKDREPPCVLITGEDLHEHTGCQIDASGARHNWNYGGSVRGRSGQHVARGYWNAWNFGKRHMSGRTIARRRHDLERFDAQDIALIQYGYDLDFTGRIGGSPYMVSLPAIVGTVWTIFWTRNWYGRLRKRDDERAAMALLYGAYHRHAFGDNRMEGYATAHRDPALLNEFEARYRSLCGHADRCTLEIVRQDVGERTMIYGRGHVGPVFHRGCVHIHDHAGNASQMIFSTGDAA